MAKPIRSFELQTAYRYLETAFRTTMGGQVAPGKKRYVTFVAVDQVSEGALANLVMFASVGVANPTFASIMTNVTPKMFATVRQTGATTRVNFVIGDAPFQIPARPDPDKPLFTILGGKWLGVAATGGTASVFIQYFDE